MSGEPATWPCPMCGQSMGVISTERSAKGGGALRRRRQCANCGERTTTYELRSYDVKRVIRGLRVLAKAQLLLCDLPPEPFAKDDDE